ncbi:MAG: hypothetical protein OXL37_09260 [Chloroflexota bacterium]|nr:hypothetical protein [Chloroflexota bacterium]MDE2960048.1 hypothetical protein [Chloroflexota bacterium]
MSDQDTPAGQQFDDQEDWLAPDPDELRRLQERLAELRAKGIISGDEGPRDSLKPVAHIPGALARFLADGR